MSIKLCKSIDVITRAGSTKMGVHEKGSGYNVLNYTVTEKKTSILLIKQSSLAGADSLLMTQSHRIISDLLKW